MRLWKAVHRQPMLESDLPEFFKQVEAAGLVDDVRLSTSHISLDEIPLHNLTFQW